MLSCCILQFALITQARTIKINVRFEGYYFWEALRNSQFTSMSLITIIANLIKCSCIAFAPEWREKVLLEAEQRKTNTTKTYLKTAFVKGPAQISKAKCQMKRSISNIRKLIWSRHMNCIAWISASGKGVNLLNQFRLIQCLVCKTLMS